MGVKGLLPLLKSIQRPTELKRFAGSTLGVDGYVWLHRGAISCAVELAQDKPTRRYVDFAMQRVRMLKHFGITPYLVFDGDYLPSKAGTEASRAKRREESRKAGLELLRAGKPSQAHLECQKAIDITPEMARHFIEELKKADVPYLVAPYEADAQLVYLEREGIISGIISEDSDLLVFGAKRLLTKLDQYGQCIEINRRDFCACREVSLTGWTDTEFRHMAILSGCDYLEGLTNMGLKTAYRMIRKYKTPDRMIRMLQFDGKYNIPANYLESFQEAESTFIHQRVYCPKAGRQVSLSKTPSEDLRDMPFIGAELDARLATAIATGDVNPITKEVIALQPLPERRRISRAFAPLSNPSAGPGGKPIESYFRGHRRIPLGEMDPNCFSVEPRQAATLTREGSAPLVFPLPRPYLDETSSADSGAVPRPYRVARPLRRRTEPISSILGNMTDPTDSRRRTAAGPIFNDANHGLDEDTSDSLPRPPKKARLCEDLAGGEDTSGIQRSKFFPSIKTKSAPRKTEGYLMSDDSIDEVLLSLPDSTDWNPVKPKKKSGAFMVYREDVPADDGEAVIPESPVAKKDGKGFNSLNERFLQTETETIGEVALPDLPSDTPTRTSLQQFSYTPGSKKPAAGGAVFFNGLPTPASSEEQPKPRTSAGDVPRAALQTPLQRLGAQALRRNQARTPPMTPLSPDRSKGPGSKRLSREPASYPVNAAFVPLPKVDLKEVEALNAPAGSEDQIVPDSDEENDMAADEFGVGASKSSRLNLSRFMYA